MTLMVGQTSTGKLIPLRVDEDGAVSTVGAGGGSGSAQELPISPGGAVIGPSAALVVALHPDSTPVEVRMIDAVRSPAAVAAGADQVVAVTNLGTLENLIGAVRTHVETTAEALDAPTSALLAELESISTAQATDATLQQVANKLDALRAQLPPSLLSGALAITGTVSLAPGATVTLASGTQVQVSGEVGANLRVGGAAVSGANPVPVGGTVSISGTPTVAVSGAVQVTDGSGPLTVDISGTPSVSISGTPTVSISGGSVGATVSDGSGALTVDGTVNADLRVGGAAVAPGNPVPVSGSVASTVSGTVTANLGTLNGAATEATLSAINAKIPASPAQDRATAVSPSAARLSDGAAFYVAAKAGDNMGADVRVGGSGVSAGNPMPVSGPVSAAQSGSWAVSINSALPSGANAIGFVGVNIGGTPISAANPAPVSAAQSGAWSVAISSLPALASGTNTIGKVDQGTGGASAWKVDGSAVTQPISATALPLATGAATSALQTAGNASLTNIDGKLPPLGQQAPSASVSIVLATGTNITSVPGEKARTPTQVTAALTTTASNLSSASAVSSSSGWELFNAGPVSVLVGDVTAQAREVLPGDRFGIPSTTLAGWYAKASAGSASVVLTGAA